VAISNPGNGERATRPSRDARQFQTHLPLLVQTRARLRVSLDAIIVPASRPAVNLDHAVMLARKLQCHLVVLCSRKAQADEVNELLALRDFSQAITVDLPEGYILPKLDLVTSRRTSLGLPDGCVNPNGDLSTKRNIGLLLARMVGWKRILFLDDDIRDLYSSDLREIAMMLGPCDAVGMRAVKFPDNSVVCHGHRRTGGYQEIFVSGSVLAVHCAGTVAFFPEIYNEDWFFFYHVAAARRLGWYGRDATQLCYDPFADPQRAAGQEFGDVLAEGLYGLLHGRNGTAHATSDYWRTFLDSRMRFLEGVLARAEKVEPYLRKRIASSIETAMIWSRQIEPLMCEHYIALWQQDLDTWEQRLKDVPARRSANAALRELDLAPSSPNLYALAGIIGGGGEDNSKDATATKSRRTSDLASSIDEGKSIPTPRGAGIISASDSGRPFVRKLTLGRQRGDGPAQGGIRRAGELVRRAIIAEERDSHPSAVGRHRRPLCLPPAALSSNTEDA
jgi:hypothetical protein